MAGVEVGVVSPGVRIVVTNGMNLGTILSLIQTGLLTWNFISQSPF